MNHELMVEIRIVKAGMIVHCSQHPAWMESVFNGLSFIEREPGIAHAGVPFDGYVFNGFRFEPIIVKLSPRE